MYSNLPLPKLLEIISRIVNDSGCTVRIVDEIPVQDREIRELCLQIYELRRAAQSIAHGELGVHFENCGCMATYLKDIMDRLKAVERGIKELAEGDTPELPRLGALGTYFELIGNTLQENRRLIEKYRNCLRVEDICCRYGGEEFLVMLYDTDVIRAALVAERLRKSIAGKPISTRGEEIRVAISLGVTEIVAADYAGTRKCHAEIRRAVQVSDAFLYKAKKAGRNRVAANLPEEDEGVA